MSGSWPWLQRWLPTVLLLGIALGIASPLLIYRAIRVNSGVLIGLQGDLVGELRQSTAAQQAMLHTLESLHQQQERYLALLTRMTDLEQRNQVLADQQIAALYHLIRATEAAAYLASVPPERKPVFAPPPAFYRWLKDLQEE